MFMRFIAPATLLLATSLADAQQAEGQAVETAVAEPPIIIDSDNARTDFRSGLTRFSDNVSIQRGAMRVSADEGVVHQTDGRYTLIELFGSPTTWRDRLDDGTTVDGQANQIRYDVVDNVVTLTGDARLSHEGGEWTGNELVYDLDTESMVGRGTSGNQARVVLESDSGRRSDSNGAQPESEAAPEPQLESESDSDSESQTRPEDGTQTEEDAAAAGSEDQDDAQQQPVEPPAGR